MPNTSRFRLAALKLHDERTSSSTSHQPQRLVGASAALVSLAALAPAAGAAPSAPVAPSAPSAPARASSAPPTIESGRLAGLRFHLVRSGETLASVSRLYGIPVETLRRANGMTGDMLYAGYRLLLDDPNPGRALPTGSTGAPAATTADGEVVFHTVKSGETLARIAKRYGSTVGVIQWINGIADANKIAIGQSVAVIGASVEAATPSMACPVPGANYRYDWGNVRGSGARFHEGLDLMAATGTPVRAMVSGTVETGTNDVSGTWVALKGTDGWQYFGAHLSGVAKTGTVRAGDIIGYVGTSGSAAGGPAHLHLELRPLDGRPTNPLPVVSRVC